jgi:hypothetical protein
MKFFLENHSGHVNIDSGLLSFSIHFSPESIFTSRRNPYSHHSGTIIHMPRNPQTASIHTLKFLAAHIVLMANRFDSAWIRGLDIALFDSDGFHLIGKAEKALLCERSKKLHALIGKRLRA